MSKKTKFFCDNCGTEVNQKDKVCKKCGKFFASVKCPACNMVGDARDFTYGCPYCGYAAPGTKSNNEYVETAKPRRREDGLPVWVYVLSLCVFAGVLYYLFNVL